ncbi:MAG: hypothetical protein JWP58_2771 [Hymenobacter sp.]|nr:hypothetical protein [Hymenobacter sp.]
MYIQQLPGPPLAGPVSRAGPSPDQYRLRATRGHGQPTRAPLLVCHAPSFA